MRRDQVLIKRALAFILWWLSPIAWGQDQSQDEPQGPPLEALPAFDLERMDLNPGRGSLLVGGGDVLLPGTFRVSLGTHYQRTPLTMRTREGPLDLVSHRVTSVLTGAYGVLPWLEANLQLPIVLMQSGDDLSSQGLRSPTSRGLGTPMVHARMGVLSRRAGHIFDMAVDLGLGLPLGSGSALARERLARFQGHVLLGRRFGPVRATLDSGLLLRVPSIMGPPALTSSRQSHELRMGAAASTVGEDLRIEAGVRAALALETGQGAAELSAGLRYPIFSWLEVYGLGGMGLGALPGTPGFRMLVGVAGGHPPPPESPVIRRASSSQHILQPRSFEEDDAPEPHSPPAESGEAP